MSYTCYIIDAEYAKEGVTEDLSLQNYEGSVGRHVLGGGSIGIWKTATRSETETNYLTVVAFYAASNYRDVRADESVIAFWVLESVWSRYCCKCRCSHCADCQCCCEMCGDCDECACCCEHADDNS